MLDHLMISLTKMAVFWVQIYLQITIAESLHFLYLGTCIVAKDTCFSASLTMLMCDFCFLFFQ